MSSGKLTMTNQMTYLIFAQTRIQDEIKCPKTSTPRNSPLVKTIIVTVHGKTYVNDLSLKRKNQRTNVPIVSTSYPNVPSIWSEKYERVKAKIHTIF